MFIEKQFREKKKQLDSSYSNSYGTKCVHDTEDNIFRFYFFDIINIIKVICKYFDCFRAEIFSFQFFLVYFSININKPILVIPY